MTKVNKATREITKDTIVGEASRLEQQLDKTNKTEKLNREMESDKIHSSQPKAQLSAEEVKLRYEKPFFGGAVGSRTMSPSKGSIRKAKQSLMANKNKTGNNSLARVIDKPCQIQQEQPFIDNKEGSVSIDISATVATNALESYDSLYNVENTTNQQYSSVNEHISPERLLNRRASVSPDVPMDQEDFQFPKRFTPWADCIQLKAKESFAIPTNNKYDSLSSDSEEEDRNDTRSPIKKRPRTTKKQPTAKPNQNVKNMAAASEGKKSMPPPIVLKGSLKSLSDIKRRLREECGITKVTFKYTRFNTLILVDNETDYNNLLKYFKEEQTDTANKILEFHTYTPSTKKTHAFVVRGLDFHPEPDEVKSAFLHEYDIEISSVYQMHTKFRPLYMIVTSSAITQKYLQSTVKYILNVRVYIEERKNVRRIIQCHRCQEWGHATSNCYRLPRCLKCAAGHATKDCKKPKDADPKCCNCGEKHPANATVCKVYQRKLADLGGKDETAKTQYKPAPLPKENAWQRNKTNTSNQLQNEAPPRRTLDQRGGEGGVLPVPTMENHSALRESSIDNRNNTVDEIVSSIKLVDEINTKVNIKELNRALNDLNQSMRQVTTGVEAFQLYYHFIENLENNYKILN